MKSNQAGETRLSRFWPLTTGEFISMSLAWFEEAEAVEADLASTPLEELCRSASVVARAHHGDMITYSPKIFIPLTRLCRDVCHYCSFAYAPRPGQRPYLLPEEIRTIAAKGREAGCGEALFTLGEQPELRYKVARDALAELGFRTTNEYCAAMAKMVADEFGLLPHINAGVMDEGDVAAFRDVSVSQGLMLENISDRLCERNQPHFGSPGKSPQRRLEVLSMAGRLAVPYTTGILIGIGETRRERIASLLAIRDLHREYGHIQEVIVQNFLPKPDTRMADRNPPDFDDLLWTAATARILLPGDVSLQVPPNLSFARFGELLSAGINDWGGISPVTPDHVNPEAPWPNVDLLRAETERHGLMLEARSPLYPGWVAGSDRWLSPTMRKSVRRATDAEGYFRREAWRCGDPSVSPPVSVHSVGRVSADISLAINDAASRRPLSREGIVALLAARGRGASDVIDAADALRRSQAGETVTYVINRNINYTNICLYRCGFCAFSKGKTHEHLRGQPYDLSLDEIAARAIEAWERGATEICMQGGIHPRFTGHDYLAMLRAVKAAVPAMHVHAFSPLEVHHGATTLGMSEDDFLKSLRDSGLGSLPGTSAEILVDRVRAQICPDKLDTHGWLRVIGKAHAVGLRTTATIMFGHVETLSDIADHLLAIRDLQDRTGGFTEFVPLPFVHAEAPISLRGQSRRGPTFRETLAVHAVARLVLGWTIPNIQTSWVKLGEEGARRCLQAGCNDLGGVLMNESISRAAGASHGQEFSSSRMEALAASIGRPSRRRTTLYGTPNDGPFPVFGKQRPEPAMMHSNA